MAERNKDDLAPAQKFLNTLSHELKIPISSISGYLSLLSSGDLGRLTISQSKVIQKTRELSLYAAELIDNLLSMASLGGRRNIRYDKIFIADLIKKALSTLSSQIKARGLKVHVKFSNLKDPVWALPLDLERIVINVLSNAVKFTPKGGSIFISANRRGAKIFFEFRDTGIGIPSNELNMIFEDFYRADNVVRQYEGCGLGLAIVKKLLKFNKGAITLKSRINKGTTVKISLLMLTENDVFQSELGQCIMEASRRGTSFSLLMLAGAKDKRGSLYKTMADVLRKTDRIFRVAKNKYAAILPDADYGMVRLVCERLKSMLEEKAFLQIGRHKSGAGAAPAMAFAVFPRDGSTKEKLLSCLEGNLCA